MNKSKMKSLLTDLTIIGLLASLYMIALLWRTDERLIREIELLKEESVFINEIAPYSLEWEEAQSPYIGSSRCR